MTKQYEVKANQGLFNEWETLAQSYASLFKNIKGIVQNDMTVEELQVDDWLKELSSTDDALRNVFIDLLTRTLQHVTGELVFMLGTRLDRVMQESEEESKS